MTKNEETPTSPLPEWPRLCFVYRDNFGFVPKATESEVWPALNTFGCAGNGLDQELKVRIRKRTHHHIITACISWCLVHEGLLLVSVHTGSGPRLHLHNTACGVHMLECWISVFSGTCWQGFCDVFPLGAKYLAQSAWFVISQRVMNGLPHSRLRKALNIVSTTHGIPCWHLCATLKFAL